MSEWLYLLLALTRSSSAPPCQSVSKAAAEDSGWAQTTRLSPPHAHGFVFFTEPPPITTWRCVFLRQLAAEMTMIVAVLLAATKKQKQSGGEKTKRFADFSWLAVLATGPAFKGPQMSCKPIFGVHAERAVCWVCNGSARIALFSMANARDCRPCQRSARARVCPHRAD